MRFPEGKVIKPKQSLPIEVDLGRRQAAFISMCFEGKGERWCLEAGPRRGAPVENIELEKSLPLGDLQGTCHP